MLPPFLYRDAPSKALSLLYGDAEAVQFRQRLRYLRAQEEFRRRFGSEPTHLYSSPGRCELGGNHTDHNGGLVLASAIQLDMIAAVATSEEQSLTVYSAGYEVPFKVSLSALTPHPSEHPTCQLMRGIASGFHARGYRVGGLRLFIQSDVLFASGLSSSATLEILLGTIINDLYNHSSLDLREVATIGQEAEHHFWGKPVGLLDQLTIGSGGVVHMSFQDESQPRIEPVPFDFTSHGYELLLVQPGGNHAQATADYRMIPSEMKSVAAYFGRGRLVDIDEADIVRQLPELRRKVGDRAVVRSLHFFEENKRVRQQVHALRHGRVEEFVDLVRASGSSSWRLLQNIFDPLHSETQPLAVALAVAELQTNQLALKAGYRVHGGGFGGTILLVVPVSYARLYALEMQQAFGEGTCHSLRVRPFGCVDLHTLEMSGTANPTERLEDSAQ